MILFPENETNDDIYDTFNMENARKLRICNVEVDSERKYKAGYFSHR